MRKLALLLGSLLVVASASAKEVVPAPVVVEEAPVQVIEKEVIVYRDKEEGFRPNGNVGLEYRYFDKTEGQKYGEWSDGDLDKYSRAQLEGTVNMTENQSFYFRVRNRHSLDASEAGKGSNDEGTQLRARYFYNHGNLGDSKVNFTSSVWYEDGYTGTQHIQYQARFDFAEYLFNNDFIKTTTAVIAPRFKYVWDSNNDVYTSKLGFYIDFINKLPFGFETELEIDGLEYNMYGQDKRVGVNPNDTVDDDFSASIGLYLYRNTNLYSAEKLSVDWFAKGGYDTYNWNSEKVNGYGEEIKLAGKDISSRYEKANYQAYITTDVKATYQATNDVKVYAGVGAEYRNWAVTNENSATNWRWQPFVFAGFKTTF